MLRNRLEGNLSMSQTIMSKEDSPLLDIAFSKLQPGIFSHPIWIRFGRKEEIVPPKTIKALYVEAEDLERYNPSDACQVLLICSASQHYAGQTKDALATIQEVQNLAQRAGLNQEVLWALWGACAICFQQKRYEQAAGYLTTLKHLLSDQDEWILAGFVDVVRQSILQQSIRGEAKQTEFQNSQPMGDLLLHTFHWLNLWGFLNQNTNCVFHMSNNKNPTSTHMRSLFSFRRLRGLGLFLRGELKISWLDTNSQLGKKRSAFWGFIFNLIHGDVKTEEFESKPMTISSSVLGNTETVILEDQHPKLFEEPSHKTNISISVHMLGKFSMTVQETTVAFPSSRSLSLLKYLLLNHKQNNPREVLMDVFWPEVTPNRARNNLNVAMSSIRKALRTVTANPIIIYRDNTYGMAPEIQLWIDVDEFERLIESGKRSDTNNKLSSAISDYEGAISLYQGNLLEENLYESWTVLQRERLRVTYLDTIDHLSQIYFEQDRYGACVSLCQLILAQDICREDTHCRLMRCYSRLGKNFLALRQYQSCIEALHVELDVEPSPETAKIFDRLRHHEPV